MVRPPVRHVRYVLKDVCIPSSMFLISTERSATSLSTLNSSLSEVVSLIWEGIVSFELRGEWDVLEGRVELEEGFIEVKDKEVVVVGLDLR